MTDVINTMAEALAELLERELAGQNAGVVAQFPNAPRPAPLKTTVVSVGVQDVELLPCAFSDYAGVDEQGAVVRGRTAAMTVAMQIYSPVASAAGECRRVFGLIANALLFSQEEYDVGKVWCDSVRFHQEHGALLLPCYARMRLTILARMAEGGIRDFSIRKVDSL